MKISDRILNYIMKKIEKEVQKNPKYELEIKLNSPFEFIMKDGMISTNINISAKASAKLLQDLINGEVEDF